MVCSRDHEGRSTGQGLLSPDSALMQAWQGGDEQALEALHGRHAGRLVGWLTRKSRDPQVAQDVAQEVWLSAHRFKAGWRQEAGAFSTWLYRIAHNALVTHHRAATRRPLTLLDRDPEVAMDWDPVARMALQKAQERLSPAAMVAFTLGAVNGLDHNEMALEMAVTPDCARARLSRACRELRETLA